MVDKFGRYKPVVIMSLLLNALFHHSLLLIPQQEIPGTVPAAYVMRHPQSGNIEVQLSLINFLCKLITGMFRFDGIVERAFDLILI